MIKLEAILYYVFVYIDIWSYFTLQSNEKSNTFLPFVSTYFLLVIAKQMSKLKEEIKREN